ncbi:MAG: phosphoribosylformylglycinamidine synthase subunit PurQ [Actinomycetota bacterium]|nr:phosphoribosylformylglycinamidine synthase subunit PurQ [Actinomycetota bacterium]
MKVGVVQFPGSLDDRDAAWAFDRLGADTELLWHDATDIGDVDAVVLPGGFSYGDYLRCGGIARFARIMEAVAEHAHAGGLVLGICNGFQILTEAGLVSGALVRNESASYVCAPVHLRVENNEIPHLRRATAGQVLRMPIKHGEGRYVADATTIKSMEERGQIVLRYCDADGTNGGNPNGSTDGIAGVCNEAGNVMGLMPHPEHAVDPAVGIRSSDGAILLGSIVDALAGAAR